MTTTRIDNISGSQVIQSAPKADVDISHDYNRQLNNTIEHNFNNSPCRSVMRVDHGGRQHLRAHDRNFYPSHVKDLTSQATKLIQLSQRDHKPISRADAVANSEAVKRAVFLEDQGATVDDILNDSTAKNAINYAAYQAYLVATGKQR